MDFYKRIANEAIKACQNGYKPSVRPACADFACSMLERAGWKGSHITYVPNFFNVAKKVNAPRAGDLIIFKGTYDAVAPTGIGPEDDKTHVGIMIGENEFIHYSASADKPVREKLERYWMDHLETFLRVDAPSEEKMQSDGVSENSKLKSIKFFYHPAAPMKVILEGKEFIVRHVLAHIILEDGTVLLFDKHPFDHYPCLEVGSSSYAVKYIGTNGIEVECND